MAPTEATWGAADPGKDAMWFRYWPDRGRAQARARGGARGTGLTPRARGAQVVMAYTVATALALALFRSCPNIAWMQWLLVAAVGFALYGPQMLIGLCGAEVVPKPSVSAANGMLGWISYLGAPWASRRV